MCIVFLFFFCVTSLCASILFHRVIVQALSLVECRPIDQFLIDYISTDPFARNLLLLILLLLLYYYYYYYYYYFLFYDDVD